MSDRNYRYNEEAVAMSGHADATDVHLKLGDEAQHFKWRRLSEHEYLLQKDGKQKHVFVASNQEERWLWCDGQVYRLTLEQQAGRRDSQAKEGNTLAPMPGQILKVFVKVGDQVEKGEPLVIMEAMKMQYEITAPRSGVVSNVHVQETEQVRGGLVLVELEEESES